MNAISGSATYLSQAVAMTVALGLVPVWGCGDDESGAQSGAPAGQSDAGAGGQGNQDAGFDAHAGAAGVAGAAGSSNDAGTSGSGGQGGAAGASSDAGTSGGGQGGAAGAQQDAGTSGGGQGGAAGAQHDAGADGGQAGAAGSSSIRYRGHVNVMEYRYYGSPPIAAASAGFYEQEASSQTPIQVGDCTVYPYDGQTAPSQVLGLDAGTVTITGAKVSPIQLTPTWYDTAGYAYASDLAAGVGELFAPGQAMRATVEGKGPIATFMDVTFQAPPDIEGLEPDILVPGYTWPATPLSLRWQGRGEQMIITLALYRLAGSTMTGMTASCATADDGSFDLPAGVYDYAPAQPNQATVLVMRSATRDVIEGETQLWVGVQTAVGRNFSLP